MKLTLFQFSDNSLTLYKFLKQYNSKTIFFNDKIQTFQTKGKLPGTGQWDVPADQRYLTQKSGHPSTWVPCLFILLMTKARRLLLFMSQVTQPYFYSLFVHCFLLPHMSLVNKSTSRKIRMSFLFCIFEGRKIVLTFSQNLLGKTKDERTSLYY